MAILICMICNANAMIKVPVVEYIPEFLHGPTYGRPCPAIGLDNDNKDKGFCSPFPTNPHSLCNNIIYYILC